MSWIVYILECADGTFYTGITNNLETRLQKHESGKGAKYTKGRGPYKILLTEDYESKSEALKREIYIKSLKRNKKLSLWP